MQNHSGKVSLAVCERVLGPEHLDTLASLNNLAILYRNLGKYEPAEPLHQRALAGRELVLGPEHPDTIRTRNNSSDLLEKMKQKTKAVGSKPQTPRKQGRK